ncbi:hypothetical protein, partial [Treponema sp. R6D11]
MPDKAIDIIDEAAAFRKLENREKPHEINGLEDEIAKLCEEKTAYVSGEDYEHGAEVRDKAR